MEETQIPPRVSVVVVSYNRAESLTRCLTALEASEAREQIEIIVVDNDSQDGSAAVVAGFPNATPLQLPRNFGFTKAVNIGMRTAKGEYILILNSRTEVQPETIGLLAACLDEDKSVVAACPRLETPEGGAVEHLYRLPGADTAGRLGGAGHFESVREPEDAGSAVAVEFAGLQALMIRSYFVKALRYIDERYAQSWADAEIAAQIRHAGKKIALVPTASAVWRDEPGWRESVPPAALAQLAADWALGASTFAGKHFGFATGLVARLSTMFGALAGLRFREFFYIFSSQKIDGTQTAL